MELMVLSAVSFVAQHFSCTFVMADMMGTKSSCVVDVLKAVINGNYLLNICLKTNKRLTLLKLRLYEVILSSS